MFRPLSIEVGDILQHKTKKGDFIGGIINFFSMGGGYVHTAIFVGHGMKAEAHMGRVFNVEKILPSDVEKIDVYRLVGGLDLEEKELLVKCVESKYGLEYNTLGLLGTLRSSIGSLLKWDWLRKSKPVAREDGKYFCSEMISVIYNEALGIDIVPETSE